MKKNKLTNLGKIIFTFIILIISLVIYLFIKRYGFYANNNQFLFIAGWTWLVFGQFIIYYFIWE